MAFDLRGSAAYISDGRAITPLFDALGSSQNLYLASPNYERLVPIEQGPRKVSMTGVTDVTPHARLQLQAGTVIQAAKYIRFMLGFGVGYATAYFLTGTDACNPNVQPSGANDPRIGACPTGILNPAHRPVIDIPGKRFIMNGEISFDLNASATAQF